MWLALGLRFDCKTHRPLLAAPSHRASALISFGVKVDLPSPDLIYHRLGIEQPHEQEQQTLRP
eukprot:770861-Amphidinium_carterae.1